MIPRITEDIKLINSIRSQFINDGSVIPNFVNEQLISHRICYDGFQKVVKLLTILFHQSRVLGQIHIRTIQLEIDEIFSECVMENADITLLYSEYTIKMLNAYLNLCNVNELYESSENLKNMIKKLNK